MNEYESLFRLDGRRALVVGAGSGIGAASAEGLAAFGAQVMCADVNEVAARGVAERIGASASALHLDITDAPSVTAVAQRIGPPDILVTTPSVNVRKRIVDYADDELDRVVDLNLKGTFRLCRTFGASWPPPAGGIMIGFTSVRAQTTEPGQGAYAATKAATVMLFKTLAAELGPSGVRANTIAPGVVETPLTAADQGPAGVVRGLRRQGHPQAAGPSRSELVGAAVFLASDAVRRTSPAPRCSWTAAGLPPTAATSRPAEAPVASRS